MIHSTSPDSCRRSSSSCRTSRCAAPWDAGRAAWRGSASAWTRWWGATSESTTRSGDVMLGRPRRVALLAEQCFHPRDAKTAVGILRYRAPEVAAVIDSTRAGSTAQQCVGCGGAVPVVGDLDAAVHAGADSLLLGIAPQGGGLPEQWRDVVRRALELGLDVISGLHVFLGDDPELARVAGAHGALLLDVRRPPAERPIAVRRPAALVLCHWEGRTELRMAEGEVFPMPPLREVRAAAEQAVAWVRPAAAVAAALNTVDLEEPAAREACARRARELGVPAGDPVRFGAGPLADALVEARERLRPGGSGRGSRPRGRRRGSAPAAQESP